MFGDGTAGPLLIGVPAIAELGLCPVVCLVLCLVLGLRHAPPAPAEELVLEFQLLPNSLSCNYFSLGRSHVNPDGCDFGDSRLRRTRCRPADEKVRRRRRFGSDGARGRQARSLAICA